MYESVQSSDVGYFVRKQVSASMHLSIEDWKADADLKIIVVFWRIVREKTESRKKPLSC